ncbi:MAG TPA: TaqI-like C-terminal specificity domain-containing protein, partial [Spirochaetota bacterium]|nr:TaqI-like C-terminal specificity domain-containing protein [Spirochaetota bacterium]
MVKKLPILNNVKHNGITISEASKKVGVSEATVRNWIKTKYLVLLSDGLICKDSFNYFMNNIVGTEKLNSRANKSRKDGHNHSDLSDKFLEKLNDGNVNLESLGKEYENLLSDSYKNKEGVYYTPQKIVKDLLKDFISIDKSNLTFCDPSCGSGNFIIEALNIGFKPENVYGFDIDPIAVEIAKKRIEEKTGYKTENIINADFLDYSSSLNSKKYDFIFTNPPWGKKIDKDKKDFYGRIFKAEKCLDTSSLFFFASIKNLNPYGIIGFLLPEAFFNISIFENARKKSLSMQILRLVDYGRVFKKLVTKAQAIVLKNDKSNEYFISCDYDNNKYLRTDVSFLKMPKSIFNFYCSDRESKLIDKIFSFPFITLKNNAKWGMGIVTGNNSKYFVNSISKDYTAVYRGSDITKNGLKETSLFIPKDLSLYQQASPKELYEAKEKIIYKFISSGLCFYNDAKQSYVLNSANMIILNDDFPITPEQLTSLLNSDIMNWIFKKIFNTHKILRSDLETLPIFYEYFKNNSRFDEETYLEYLEIKKNQN